MGKFDGIGLGTSDFGDNVSTHTILTGPQLQQLFPSEEEKQAFLELLNVIDAATSENEQKAEIIGNINKYAGLMIKLVRKATFGV